MISTSSAKPGMFLAVLLVLAVLTAAPLSGAVYYVDQSHPKALDANAGTEDIPFKTISAAVAKVKPGDTVYVKNGVYRESVRRVLQGDGFMQPTERMTLTAAPGHRPVVKGSEIVTAKFEPVRVALRKPAKADAKVDYDPNAWRKQIGVDTGKQVEAAPVVTPPGAEEVRDAKFVGIYVCPLETYSSYIFVDNGPLVQVGLKGNAERAEKGEGMRLTVQWNGKDISDMKPGTFYCDAANKKLYVWLADSGDPNKHVIEAAVRGAGIELYGTWTVNGFTVTQHQDNFHGGETAMAVAGRRAIIENCRVIHNKYIGIILHGTDGVLRNCEIGYNGICGISPSLGWRMLVEGNDFHHNTWDGGLVCCHGDNKICQWKDTRILRNRYHDEHGGIWLDINVNRTLIAENTFENCEGGIFIEISRWVIVVNNTFRNCRRAVMVYSSDVLIANNVLDGCAEGIDILGYPRGCAYKQSYYDNVDVGDSIVADCLMAARNTLVVNNIIVNSVASYVGASRDEAYGFANYSDYNVFAWTFEQIHKGGNHIKFMAGWDDYYGRLPFWQMERHYDEHSTIADPGLYNAVQDGSAWPEIRTESIVRDARFFDRDNGDYRLRPDSPLKGKGIGIPMVLNSTYVPAKDYEINSRAWAPTDLKSPAGKGRAMVGEVWGQKFYRIQPLPQVHRLVDLDEQGPADPGINYTWRDTGKYPDFRLEGPPETAPDDLWIVNPVNRLKNGDFNKAFFGEMHMVDAKAKGLGDWQVTAGKIACQSGAARADLTAENAAAAAATGVQKLGPIQPKTDYLLWADMKVDGLKEGYTTTGRFYLAAGKELTPIKSVEVKTAGKRDRHWNTFAVYYKSGADAKADPFVGKDLHVVFTAVAEGPKDEKNKDPVGSVQWDNFQLLSGEPVPAK